MARGVARPTDVILTERLPARCPACGRKDPTRDELHRTLTSGATYRVSCPCGWFAKYEMREATA